MISSLTTYGMLDKILTRLCFEKKWFEDGKLGYYHRETDLLIVMQPGDPNEKADGGRLLTAERMILMYGLATQAEWERLVRKVWNEADAEEAENGVHPEKQTAGSQAA